jgi:hypothetical protein
MMDFFDCPNCLYRHPWLVTDERPCPNVRLSEAQCQRVFFKPLAKVLRHYVPPKPVPTVAPVPSLGLTVPSASATSATPWLDAGVSRRTWFRQRARAKGA